MTANKQRMPFKYNAMPLVAMILCFSGGISLWGDDHKILGVLMGVAGIVIFVINDRVRTKMWQDGKLPLRRQ